jgi:spore germination protein GerM
VVRDYNKPEITLDDVLTELFQGPNQEEATSSYTSVFSKKSSPVMRSIKITDETVYLNLYDIRKRMSSVSSSCGSESFLSEIGQTLKENAGISKVVYAINGNPKTFYDWIQVGCSTSTNNCDLAPFK